MLELYTWKTPNGRKISIMLEELGLPYEVRPIDLSTNAQKSPEYLAINPNGKIPALVDSDGPGGKTTIFESGAILIYLADKTGRFLPRDGAARYDVLAWLMFQMGGIGPMFGQALAFSLAKEKNAQAIEKFVGETRRLCGVLEHQLATHEYLAGEYSIADIASYAWVSGLLQRMPEIGDFPSVKRWLERVAARPAVQRGMQIP